MFTRRAGFTLAGASLATVLAFGLAAPASAAPAAPPTAAVQAGTTAHLSGKDPFPKMSPAKIKAKSLAAVKAAKTVHVRSYYDDGDQVVKTDSVLTRTAGRARITMSKEGSVFLIRYGSEIFLSGDAKFWTTVTEDESMADLAGKWIKVSGNSAEAGELRDAVSITAWTGDLVTFRAAKRVAGKKIGGKPTVGLLDQAGKDGSILYVAATGTPYPLYFESNDKLASVTYSEWNKPVKITKPKAEDVISL